MSKTALMGKKYKVETIGMEGLKLAFATEEIYQRALREKQAKRHKEDI